MRIQASEIEGLEKYGSGQIWWPDIPTIQPVGSYYISTNLYSFIESKDPYYILNF